jgi:hypothetical protein
MDEKYTALFDELSDILETMDERLMDLSVDTLEECDLFETVVALRDAIGEAQEYLDEIVASADDDEE